MNKNAILFEELKMELNGQIRDCILEKQVELHESPHLKAEQGGLKMIDNMVVLLKEEQIDD